jgi:hypothetical protein
MAWARLDDQFAFNTKVVKAGNEVAGIFARAICWASANDSDGFIPDEIALLLAGRRRQSDSERALKCVSSAGLWIPVVPGESFVITGRKDSGRRFLPDVTVTIEADGYYIRDFLHYNRARTDARAGESADARANVQRVRAHKDARAARPVPSLPIKEPSLPSNESRPEPPEGQEGINIGKILKEVDAA